MTARGLVGGKKPETPTEDGWKLYWESEKEVIIVVFDLKIETTLLCL